MLLESTRFLPGDLEHWRRMEALDARWCKTVAFARKIDRALRALDAFHAAHDGGGYCGVSWGKDSCVVAHMCAGRWPLLHIRWPRRNPDSATVATAMGVPHLEWIAPPETDFRRDFADARKAFGLADLHISGVRAAESRVRRIRHMKFGENSQNTCAPLSAWSGEDVFAYLHLHNLPVHPAYAMTLGGRLDRIRIRVDDIGEDRGGYFGREEWERTYYPEFFNTDKET